MPTKNFITLQQAIQMTGSFRSNKEVILSNPYKDRNILPVCETFDRAAFDSVLAQPDCAGLRVYFGMDENNLIKAIVVGVNSKNEDIVPVGAGGMMEEESNIIEDGLRCPDTCPPSSPLNG